MTAADQFPDDDDGLDELMLEELETLERQQAQQVSRNSRGVGGGGGVAKKLLI